GGTLGNPSGFTLHTVSGTQLNLSWGSATGAAGYRLAYLTTHYPTDCSQSVLVGNTTVYALNGLSNGTTYYMRLISDDGNSPPGLSSGETGTAATYSVPSLGYALASGTLGAVGYPMHVSPTTVGAYGPAVTSCGIKPGSPNAGAFPATLSIDA